MVENNLYKDVDDAYVSYIKELIFNVILEIDNIIDRKDFDKTKLMLLFIEVINLLRIDDKLFNMVIDKIRNLYQNLHNSENRDFFLDRFIEFRNFLRFRLKYDKNINLIDLDENGKK